MEYTQKDLDALKSAYATGAKSVKYGDKEIAYADDILKRIEKVESELGIASKTISRKFAEYGRGFE
jgi:hypothetical protein